MIATELFVVLAFIYLGARMGGIGIGLAGGAGVLVLTLILGLDSGHIPVDVILIIMSVIAAIAAMQVAGRRRIRLAGATLRSFFTKKP
ncbi:hypothetical protein TUM4630_26460 [Shewanella algidipiscicola]|uniref:C4-dicarboxylate transporter DcuA n=1 Tax=Shewanella algidipiscicola TaxID=614070 RepID=A0ABQ4PLQ3_9GAMM|nr:hypothetical protein TUM4630_26460 [Shewanella algidipiscicola]